MDGPSPPSAADLAIIERMWAKVEAGEAEDDDHRRLLDAATRSDALSDLARRYRTLRDELPEDDPRRAAFGQRLTAIATVAMSRLDGQRSQESTPPRAARILVAVVTVFCLTAMLMFAYVLARG